MGALSVRVLGELSIDGLEVRSLVDRKARLLLRCLAMARGRPVSAAALIDALWHDAPPARPADQVSVLISRLRRALGRDAVELGDHGYRLIYDWLDLDELDGLVDAVEQRTAVGERSGAAAAARVAVSLLRGPLPAPGSDADWVLADHDAALGLVRRVRRSAATALLVSGSWLDALDLAAANARDDPYDEDAVRLVMLANVNGGRPAAALAAYADLRATLADELGTDPGPETEALHTAVLRGDLAIVAEDEPVDGPPSLLVGRTSQLDHLDRLADRLGDGVVRVAAVRGEAGIGKTTLLRAWSAARVAAGDTVLFGTCGSLDASAPLDVLLAAIGTHLRGSTDSALLLGEDTSLLSPLLTPAGSTGTEHAASIADGVLGPASIYAAITGVLGRIAGDRGLIVILDDAHLAGPALGEWATFAARRSLSLLVVAAGRPAEGAPFPATETVNLGPLDLAAIVRLVGSERADDLYERSRGHPLFLSELASAPEGALPPSLVDAIDRRCDDLGPGSDLLRSAAILGDDLDVELLAAVLNRPVLAVLADLETATDRQLLVETSGRFSFRHALVRQALADGTRGSRAALLHREAGKVLASRPDADPVAVAEHARRGGDLVLASRSLRTAASRAADRFDHATAEDLLDQSLRLAPDDTTLLARARIRTRLGRYADAEADVAAASAATAEGAEVGAWAAYFDRRFDDAARCAADGELTAEDPALRARCLIVGGRTLHARGDLAEADRLLTAAAATAVGSDRLSAAAWLGVLSAHRSEADKAIDLLRAATRPGVSVDHTSATLHALLFTGHAHAAAGRPAAALDAFRTYTDEVDRRHVPRFGARGVNSLGWVLRNVGAVDEARDAHLEALAYADTNGATEVRVAALEDLADDRLLVGELDDAGRLLADADQTLVGDLVFGWRLAMKSALLHARLAIAADDPGTALTGATRLAVTANEMGIPRYASVARLLVHQARTALGEPVDLAAAWNDLALAEASVAIEAWWWAGETGAALGLSQWIDRAEVLAAELAEASGDQGAQLRADATRRLEQWRLRLR